MKSPTTFQPTMSGSPDNFSAKTSASSIGDERGLAPSNGGAARPDSSKDFSPDSVTSSVKDAMGNVMSDMAGVARNAATSTAKAMAAQASQLASSVTDELASTADTQKAKGAEAIKGIAAALEKAAGEFSEPAPMVADYMKSAANQIDGLSKSIRDRSVQELVGSAQDLARNQPALFFAGAVAAGFAVSRLLKSSAPRQASPASHLPDRSSSMTERAMHMQGGDNRTSAALPAGQQAGYRPSVAPGRTPSQYGGSGSDRS